MAKLEWTPVFDFDRFNFLGKRLFDFVNNKIQIYTGTYTGNLANREISVDIIPRCIIIFSENDAIPIIWIDSFETPLSKQLDGVTINDGILGLASRKLAFIVGTNILVNDDSIDYYFIVFGS